MDPLTRLFVFSMGIVLVLVSANGVTGNPSGVVPEKASCMEIDHCSFDIMRMLKALDKNNKTEACAVIVPSVKCMKSAYKDCQEKEILPQQQLDAISAQASQVESLVEAHCSDDGREDVEFENSWESGYDCEKLVLCSKRSQRSDVFHILRKTGKTDAICSVLGKNKICIESALLDCRERQKLSEEEIQSAEQTLKDLEDQLKSCPLLSSETKAMMIENKEADVEDGNIDCMESNQCMLDEDDFAKHSSLTACSILVIKKWCFDSAINDCKRRKVSEADIPMIERKQKSLEPHIQKMCQPVASGGVHCMRMRFCVHNTHFKNPDEYKQKRQYKKACSLLISSTKCLRAALDDCESHVGVWSKEEIYEAEYHVAYNLAEINRLNCNSGNSAVVSMATFPIFLAPLWIFLMNCKVSIM